MTALQKKYNELDATLKVLKQQKNYTIKGVEHMSLVYLIEKIEKDFDTVAMQLTAERYANNY